MPRHRSPGRAILACAVVAVTLVAVPRPVRAEDESKIAMPLLDLVFYVEEYSRNGKRSEIPLPGRIPIDASGRVPVVIAVAEVTTVELDSLRGLNAVVQSHDPRAGVVYALVPLRRMKDLARRPWVLSVRLPSYGG